MVIELSTSDAAEFLNLSERRIQQLTKEGIIEKLSHGKYDAKVISEKYYKFLYNNGDVKSYEQERALHEVIKRKLSEIKLSKTKNELHDAKDVEYVMTHMLVTFRNRILSTAMKLAPQLIGQKNLNSISEIIEKEINNTLQELSEYDPNMFITELESGEEIEEEDS